MIHNSLISRLFTACVYGSGVFSAHDFYFWIPMIGPWVGGALAGVIYRFGVEVRQFKTGTYPNDIILYIFTY